MTLLILALAALACAGVGYALGYYHGHDNGVGDAYDAVEDYYRRTGR